MYSVRGGYDSLSKQVLNLIIKNGQGHIILNQNKYPLVPHRDNTLELVNYNGMYNLLLNEGIIFEHKSLFSYILELELDTGVITPHYISYKMLRSNDIMRYLN